MERWCAILWELRNAITDKPPDLFRIPKQNVVITSLAVCFEGKMDDTKRCTKCEIEKDRGEFNKVPGNKDGLCGQCKECKAAYDAVYNATHQQERAAYCAAYYAAHREDKAAYNAAYQATHPRDRREYNATYQAAHKAELAARHAEWIKSNPDKRRAAQHRRRARKMAVGGNHTAKDIQRQLAIQKGKCWWCGEPCADKYHADHLIPLSRGGHNNPSNIVISCPSCNSSKKDKLPEDWAGKLF